MQASAQTAQVREHSEIITSRDRTFEIDVRGTVDPENIEITIENVGEAPAVNPRITVNGRYDWYTLKDMAEEITAGCTTEQEKVMAIFDFVEKQSYWWSYPKDRTSLNPVRHFNVYGYHICSQAACQFVAICRAIGIEARVYEIWHHTVAEAKWDGVWHHMDPDIGIWYLKDDNVSVASIEELGDNPEWVARTYKPYRWYTHPEDGRKVIYKPDTETAGEGLALLYETMEDNYVETHYDKWMYEEHNMELTLRPDERLVRWWTPRLRKHYDQQRSHEPPSYANGQLVFEPDFTKRTYDGMISRENVRFKAEDGKGPAVHVDRLQSPRLDRFSQLTIPMASPYVMVGGHIDTRYYKGSDKGLTQVSLAAKLDPVFGQTTQLWNYYSWAYGLGDCRAVLDDKMLKDGPQGTYSFDAVYTLSADSRHADTPAEYPLIYGGQSGLDRVKIVVDLQVNPRSLPALSLGKNVIRYRDESGEGRRVKVTYKWREISDQHPPSAPAEAIFPKNGVTLRDLAPKFEWAASTDPDGDSIVNYRFQLSLRPDCAWPVSQTFDRDVRKGVAFQAPRGWLNRNTTYYWRVRAEDSSGRFGPWSEIFSFSTR